MLDAAFPLARRSRSPGESTLGAPPNARRTATLAASGVVDVAIVDNNAAILQQPTAPHMTMGSAQEWVGWVAGVVTLASFVGGLSLAWRVHRRASSAGIAFAPMAAAVMCCHAWLLYGRAVLEPAVVWVNAWGLPLLLFNALVHRAYSSDWGPGWALLGALAALQVAAPMMTVSWLGRLASFYTVACNAAPLARVTSGPLPELAVWALAACGLWTAYGALAGDVLLCSSNLLGALVAVAELSAAAWYRRNRRN
ncbi:uncharacterized protein LOC144109439 [Amblyomma americanum]